MNDTEKLKKLREKLKENEWRDLSGSPFCLGCGYARSWNGFGHASHCWLEKEIDKLDEPGVFMRKLLREIKEVLKMLDGIRERLDR